MSMKIGKHPDEIFKGDEYHIKRIKELLEEKKEIESKMREHRKQLSTYNDSKPSERTLASKSIESLKKILSYIIDPKKTLKEVYSRIKADYKFIRSKIPWPR